MKAINEMNMLELAQFIEPIYGFTEISSRLRELHDLTRWISVEERLPTCEIINEEQRFWVYINGIVTDACISGGVIHIWKDEAFNSGWSEYKKDDFRTAFTHWRSIDKP